MQHNVNSITNALKSPPREGALKVRTLLISICAAFGLAHADNWCWDHAGQNGQPYTSVTTSNGVTFSGTISSVWISGSQYQPLNTFTPWPNGSISFMLQGYNFYLPLDYKWADQAAQTLQTAKLQGKQVAISACFAPYIDPVDAAHPIKSSWIVTAVSMI